MTTPAVETEHYELRRSARGWLSLYVKDVSTVAAALEKVWVRDLETLYRNTSVHLADVCRDVKRRLSSPTVLAPEFALDGRAFDSAATAGSQWTVVPCHDDTHSVVVLLHGAEEAYYLDANEHDPKGLRERARAAFAPRALRTLLPSVFPHDHIAKWRQTRGVCMAITYWVALNFILNPNASIDDFRSYVDARIQQWTPERELSKVVEFLRRHVPSSNTNVAGLPLLAQSDPQSVCAALRDWASTREAIAALHANMSYEQYIACPTVVQNFVKLHPFHTQARHMQPTPAARARRNESPYHVWPAFLEFQVLLLCGFAAEWKQVRPESATSPHGSSGSQISSRGGSLTSKLSMCVRSNSQFHHD